MRFKDDIVIVTGSTRGIGKEVAKSFAQEGAVVMVLGRDEKSAARIKEEIVQKGFRAESFGCDVTNPVKVQKIVNKILDKYKRVDILVNNAGIAKDNLLSRMSETDWDDVINVNLKGVYSFTKAITKAMLKAKKGKIINVSSIIGMKGNIGQANYAASKAGIIGFTKAMALELASRGININAVAPGYIETDMTSQLNDNARDEIQRSIPMGKLGTPKDVAGVCLFLASKEAGYITGQTITIDGGMAI